MGGEIHVRLSTGSGFDVQVWPVPNVWSPLTWTGDFNGDGKTDIAVREAANLYVHLSTGSGFDTQNWPVPNVWGGADYNWAGDFNGDGKTDLVTANGADVHVRTARFPYPDLLLSVINGLGVAFSITHKPLTDSSVYTKDLVSTYPYQDAQPPIYVVSSASSSNGVGGNNTTTYQYGGLKQHLTADTSLAFRWMQITDPAGLIHVTYNNQNRTAGIDGTIASSETYANNVRIKYVSNTYALASNVCGGRPQAQLTSNTEETRELDNTLVTTVTTTTSYDSCGFPTTVVVDYGGGNKKTVVNQYNHDLANWRLGQLTRADVTAEAPNQTAHTRTSAFVYNTLGLIEQEAIEPGNTALAVTTTYGYDVFGNRTSKAISGSGISTRTESQVYDSRGQFVVSKTNALGHTSTFEYDARNGAVTKITDPNLLITILDYDGFGRKGKEIRPDGVQSITTYASTTTGYSIHIDTDGSGDIWTFYDRLGRVIRSSTQAFGGQWIYKDTTYNTLGQVSRVSHPDFSTAPPYGTDYTYDMLGRVTSVTEPGSGTTSSSYNGLSTTVTNPLGQAKTTVKDAQGRVTSVTDNAGTVTYNYDPIGNLTSVNALGSVVSMQYDIRGRKTAMQDPDMGSWSYAYNVLGELTSQTDAKNQTMTMAYDALGRMTTRTTIESSTNISRWTYDTAALGTTGRLALGKLATVTRPVNGSSRTYTYNDLGLQATETTSYNGASYIVTTAYDNLSRVDTVTYPSTGYKVKQAYDAFGYLFQVKRLNGATETLIWQANASDAQGRITDEVFGNLVYGRRIYDPETKDLKAIHAGPNIDNPTVQKHAYTFDALDNLTQRIDQLQGLAENFTYDNLNRLTQATGAVTKTYAYSPNGNLTYKSDVGTYAYTGPKPHAVTGISGTVNTTCTYDANGSQLTGGGRNIAYTPFNKPYTITKNGATTTINYDADFNRLRKITPSSTTLYIGKLYENVTTGTLTEHKHYLYAGASLVAIYTDRSNGVKEHKYIHANHLDSIDVITGEQGQVLERLSFDPHGKRRNVNGTDATSITSSINRGYTRHEHDDEAGLINMNARLYDPLIGRFIAADTIVPQAGDSQAYNRYSYVRNNPLSLTDPSGHSWLSKGLKRLHKNLKRFVHKWGRTIVAFGVGMMTGMYTGSEMLGGAVGGWTATGNSRGLLAGAVGGAMFGGINTYYGNLWNPQRVFANAVTGGVASEVGGGKFRDGFWLGFYTSSAYYGWTMMRDATDALKMKAVQQPDGTPAAYNKYGELDTAGTRDIEYGLDANGKLYTDTENNWFTRAGMNVEGTPPDWYSANSFYGRFVNLTSKVHDFMNSWGYNPDTGRWISNSELYNTTFQVWSFTGMLPAAAFTAFAHTAGPMTVYYDLSRTKQ